MTTHAIDHTGEDGAITCTCGLAFRSCCAFEDHVALAGRRLG